MKGKYIYGIINSKEQNPGDSLIAYRDLAVIVREAEFKDYETLPKEEVIKELTSHQQTIEKIMENFGSVLPVKFGTILKDEEEVRLALEKGYSFLKEALRKMEAKIELDLVCFWNEQKAAQLAFQESKKIRDYHTSEVARRVYPVRNSSDGEMEAKIALGKLVAQYLAAQKEKISNQILEALKRVAVENCPHVLADVNMLLNQAFLVEKENEETFNHTLNRLDSKFSDLVNFRLVGPLPPYSFATVVIENLDKGEVKAAKQLLKLRGELSRGKVKHAYNQLATRFHPDKGGDSLMFEFVTRAYKLLRKYAEHGLIGVSLHKWKEQGRL